MLGNVIDIKKFTVHDGPGIRSTVFLKGCHLRCQWCHNPEGLENRNNLWYFEKKCIKCHKCISACLNNAISIGEEKQPHIVIARERCTNSGKCVEICPTTALCFDGKEISSYDVVQILIEDKAFYEQSGGGITLSGGDPLFQYEFSLEILKACKSANIHTAIESCIFAKKDILEQFLDCVNLFIVDIKLLDCNEHKKYTGVKNELIKSNFKLLASQKVNMMVRIPLIPGITAMRDNIKDISRFVHDTNGDIPIELINFNPLAENKYRLMGKNYGILKDLKPFSDSQLDELYQIIKNEGVKAVRETKVSY